MFTNLSATCEIMSRTGAITITFTSPQQEGKNSVTNMIQFNFNITLNQNFIRTLLCNESNNYAIYTQRTVRLHSQQALMVHLEVTEDKQYHCTVAKLLVLYAYGKTSLMLHCN